jgi:hypothetical protein
MEAFRGARSGLAKTVKLTVNLNTEPPPSPLGKTLMNPGELAPQWQLVKPAPPVVTVNVPDPPPLAIGKVPGGVTPTDALQKERAKLLSEKNRTIQASTAVAFLLNFKVISLFAARNVGQPMHEAH